MKRILVLGLAASLWACLEDKNIEIIPEGNKTDTVINIPVVKPPIAVNCSPDTVYFKQKILPLIVSNCAMSGCHDAISKRDGVILTDYTNIMREVKISNPTDSDLYKSLIEIISELPIFNGFEYFESIKLIVPSIQSDM